MDCRQLQTIGCLTYSLTPRGGGFGDPKERDREKIRRDVRDGLVSPEAAENVSGVKV